MGSGGTARRAGWSRRAQGLAAVGFARVTGLLPLPVCRALGRMLGRLALLLVPKLKRVGSANLDLAYGDSLSPSEKRGILKQAAGNLGIVAAEFPHIRRLNAENLDKFVDCAPGPLRPGTPAVLVGAHLGNWELFSAAMPILGYNAAGIVRRLDSPTLERYVDGVRQSHEVKTIDRRGAGTRALRFLRERTIVLLLADQSPVDNGVPVTFFQQPCWATVAPVMLALRARVPVHPVLMARMPDGRYRFETGPEIPLTRTGRLHDDLVANTQRCQDAIEEMVRRHPGQWLWFHKRWKPRARLSSEWEARRARHGGGRQTSSPGDHS